MEKIKRILQQYLDILDFQMGDTLWPVECKIEKNPPIHKLGTAQVAEGASKFCLVFNKLPFVVKWSDSDEALQEVLIYRDAQIAGLQDFFPKTELLYERNNIHFVLQEKVDCTASDMDRQYRIRMNRITRTPTEKIYRKMNAEIQKTSGFSRNLDDMWAKAAISLYGKEKCKRLCEFIINHDINDLHRRNIGYKKYKPVILDFSGYHRR